ncbi:YgaP-like transmembrane domain, partial [Nonlabens ulvanivorans]
MKKNLGNIDRIVRVLFAVIVSILFFTNVIT